MVYSHSELSLPMTINHFFDDASKASLAIYQR